jgi:hypothetical protein
MTFYNVISALLFLGAVQQVLLGLQAWDPPHLLMGATLSVLVFNDAVYTSHVVECEKTVSYKLPLMLDDLLNFCLLALAIVALNPITNLFDVNLSMLFGVAAGEPVSARAEMLYWVLLGIYWMSIMFWTWKAGKYHPAHLVELLHTEGLITDDESRRRARVGYPRFLWLAAAIISVTFFIEAVCASVEWNPGGFVRHAVALAYVLIYIAFIRPPMLSRWKLAQLTALKA